MESAEFHHAAALLAWQVELGADEAICDTPVNRYELPAALAKPAKPAKQAAAVAKVGAKPVSPPPVPDVDFAAISTALAAHANDLDALRLAVSGFEHCELKRGARNLLFGEGQAGAKVMVIGEAPNRADDRTGAYFDGAMGQLFDKMIGAIGLSRSGDAPSIYLSPILPWRPPQDRDPKPEELAMMRPFVERQIALVDPDVLVLMGNAPCQALLGKRGITRLRGEWVEVAGRPTMPMFHPDHLMRNPLAKREAWADLLAIKARLQR